MTDRNLLFGLIALQSDLIEMRQFVDACTLWGSRKQSSLADVLVEQGWLIKEDREHVEYLLKRRMEKAAGDLKKSLSGMPDSVKTALESIGNDDIQSSLSGIDQDARITTTMQISPEAIPDERITRRGLHSTGGIGNVWLAYDKVLEREIALKELKSRQSESPINRERFIREAQITAQLTHPGTVPVYDYVLDGNRSFYTMKFVRGETFGEKIAEYHRWRREQEATEVTTPLMQLLNQFISVCQTIAFAHSKKIVHRDLKPDNIVVGDFGEVVVLDWGLAKRLGEKASITETVDSHFAETLENVRQTPEATVSQTMQGDKLGTPAYMSPEQARGEIDLIDARTDIYGLAAILYEILVGEPPFLGKSIVEVLEKVIHDKPAPPGDRIGGVPRELEQICLRGLSKKRDDRQQSAASIGEEIQQWIAQRAERKRTDQERERFFNLSLDLLTILDSTGRLTQCNPAWESVLGWQPKDLLGKAVWELIDPVDHARAVKNHQRILSGESLTEIEYRCLCSDGSHRWILWNAKLIPGESSIYLVGRDITERKRSEKTFQDLLESAPDAMAVVNESGAIVLVNAQLEKLFGYDRSELLGGPIETLVPKKFRAGHPANVAGFMRDAHTRPMGEALDLSGERKDGSVFPVEVSLSPVQTEQGLLVSCAVRDLTERNKQQRKLQSILNAAPDAIVVADSNRKIVQINHQTEQLFGYSQSELLGRSIETLLPERYREGHPEKFAEYANAPHVRPMGAGLKLYARCKDGSEVPAEISLSPLLSDEEPLFISTIRNVTEHRRNEELLAAVLESAPDAIVIVDVDRQIKLVNSQTERLFGYQRSELIGQLVETLIPERFGSGHPQLAADYLADPQVRSMGTGLNLMAKRKDGSEFPVEISLSPVETPDGLLISSAIRDVSHRKSGGLTGKTNRRGKFQQTGKCWPIELS